jgi:hypothetical protein
MKSKFKKQEINKEISKEIRKFFNENEINIDEMLLFEKHNTENIIELIKEIENINDNHKILIFSMLLELRQQIKSIQINQTEISKQIEEIKNLTSSNT